MASIIWNRPNWGEGGGGSPVSSGIKVLYTQPQPIIFVGPVSWTTQHPAAPKVRIPLSTLGNKTLVVTAFFSLSAVSASVASVGFTTICQGDSAANSLQCMSIPAGQRVLQVERQIWMTDNTLRGSSPEWSTPSYTYGNPPPATLDIPDGATYFDLLCGVLSSAADVNVTLEAYKAVLYG